MDVKEFKKKAGEYLGLLDELKKQSVDEVTALAILREVTKDMRMAQIREERMNGNGQEPATQRQLNYLNKLGVKAPKHLTKIEASALIDEELGKESDEDSSQWPSVPEPWYSAMVRPGHN
jgi:hypothetical protein